MKLLTVACCLLAPLAVSAQDWVSLIPDPDLAGWNAFAGEWTVEDGVLAGSAGAHESAWIVTDREFADFDLEMEVLLPKFAHADIVFRGHVLPILPMPEEGDPENGLYGYAVNVHANGDETDIAFADRLRRGQLVKAKTAADAGYVAGEWNTVLVSVRGQSVIVQVNGNDAVGGSDNTYTKGVIGLAVATPDGADQSELRVRNARIKDLGRSGDWTPLFNGENFDGWTIWGTEEWAVEDGAIVGRSGPKKSEGYLATNRTWRNFHVRGAFKLLGDGNFGLFFHSTIEYDDEQYPVISGVQGEVEPSYPGNSGWMYESYKRGWLVEPDRESLSAYALRVGEWNEIEIKREGNHHLSWVNGVNVMDWNDPAPNLVEGSFALQLHAGGVDGIMWKDLYVLDE